MKTRNKTHRTNGVGQRAGWIVDAAYEMSLANRHLSLTIEEMGSYGLTALFADQWRPDRAVKSVGELAEVGRTPVDHLRKRLRRLKRAALVDWEGRGEVRLCIERSAAR